MDRDPDTIESEIERTRSRIEARLDALSSQFTPSNLMDRALGTDSTNTEQDTFGLMVERARSNPYSALLIGAGLAGMVLNKPKPRPVVDPRVAAPGTYPIEPYSDDPAARIGHNIDTLETQASALSRDVSETVGDVVETVTSTVGSAVDSVKGAVAGVTGRVRNAAYRGEAAYADTRRSAAARASEWNEYAREAPVRARAGADFAVDWMRTNPLPTGLFALAAGAAVASLFAAGRADTPRSRAASAEELHARAEAEAARRAARRDAVAAATARSAAAAAQTRPATPSASVGTTGSNTLATGATSAMAKPRAGTTAARKATTKSPTSRATQAGAVETAPIQSYGENLERSTSVQGTPDTSRKD